MLISWVESVENKEASLANWVRCATKIVGGFQKKERESPNLIN